MAKGNRNGHHQSPRVCVAFPQGMFDIINALAEKQNTTYAQVVRQLIRKGLDASPSGTRYPNH